MMHAALGPELMRAHTDEIGRGLRLERRTRAGRSYLHLPPIPPRAFEPTPLARLLTSLAAHTCRAVRRDGLPRPSTTRSSRRRRRRASQGEDR
jgi:hypothetical protein